MGRAPRTFCLDIGGTGIKGLVADAAGKPLNERVRVETPRPATTRALFKVIAEVAQQQPRFDRVSSGFPGVVKDGVVFTAPNLHPSWAGVKLARELERLCGKPA